MPFSVRRSGALLVFLTVSIVIALANSPASKGGDKVDERVLNVHPSDRLPVYKYPQSVTEKSVVHHHGSSGTLGTQNRDPPPASNFQLVSTSTQHKPTDKMDVWEDDIPINRVDMSSASKMGYATIESVRRPPRPQFAGGSQQLSNRPSGPINANKYHPYPNKHLIGNPTISSIVVQDFTNVPSKLLHEVDSTESSEDFTDKIQETPLYDVSSSEDDVDFVNSLESLGINDYDDEEEEEEEEADDNIDQEVSHLSNPPELDMSRIVEDALKHVFQNNKLSVKKKLVVVTSKPSPWTCSPVTCCAKVKEKLPPTTAAGNNCSTFKCVAGRPATCPASRPITKSSLIEPINNELDPNRLGRDGEPRFKHKKVFKKKKKFLKKYMMPLLMGYKLLFLLVVPLMVNGMMMMMSSSGMAGFFFALLGASVAMVRVYTNSRVVKVQAPPQSNKVVKVIKYVTQTEPAQMMIPATAAPTPMPVPMPAPMPAPMHVPAPAPQTIIHHQPYMEEHFPNFAPYPHYGPPPPHPPPYMPYWDRKTTYDGGRRRKRRKG